MPEVRAQAFPSAQQASHWMPAPSMDNRLLAAIEALVEPLASVASLWLLIWWFGEPIEMLIPERYRSVHPGHRLSFFEHPSARA